MSVERLTIWTIVHNLWKRRPKTKNILAVLTAVLAVAAIATYFITSETLKRSQRAWVSPVRAEIDGDISSPLLVRIAFKNTGKEVAMNMVHLRDGYDFPVTPDAAGTPYIDLQNTPWPDNKLCEADISTYKFGRPIYPEVGYSDFKYLFPDKDDPKIGELRNKTLSIIVYGCFIYKSFDEWRHSPYCLYLQHYRDRPVEESTFEFCPITTGRAD